jgi:hypothetical protein
MKNTKFLFGLLATVIAVITVAFTTYNLRPECPESNATLTTDADTAYIKIVTAAGDTACLAFAIPAMQKTDSTAKHAVIVENLDSASFRIVTDDADASFRNIEVITRFKTMPTDSTQVDTTTTRAIPKKNKL